mmetsp:Transcript_92587/g.293606  ORF Transcript_92587/g.293606 Transcript_92587/m.293606 type:complete len:87 (-) Transcript_92587:73-333(-)
MAGMAACRQALHAWQRHCVQVRCVREVQLVEHEKDAILRELSLLQDDRERSSRNTLATIERSMSAALLARALEGESPVGLSQLLPG